MRLLVHMGQEERRARAPELRQSIALFADFGGGALALHIATSGRAVIVRATVFTRVLPQSRAQGSSCTQVPFICRDEDVQEAVFWADRGGIARRHAGAALPVSPGQTGAAR